MTLAIISHTEHYITQDGSIVGWGPTVNEINHLLSIFDSIVHVAMLHPGTPPASAMPYCSDKITFVSIPVVGGTTFLHKVNILWHAPGILQTVSKTLEQVDYFQLRTPMGLGVFLIPYLTFFSKAKGWYKYAGNWNQEHPPLGYRLQRWMLKKQLRKVTINGHWTNQPKHCLSFENPCLTLDDINDGQDIIKHKHLTGKLSFCFVGRLEREKGVERIIKAFGLLSDTEKLKVETVHLVGDGLEFDYFEDLSQQTDVDFVFHGFLPRPKVLDVYRQCHVFLLPTTASEGFPKVIAEAMNYGCVPILSQISSIGQYIKHEHNGILLEAASSEHLLNAIITTLRWSNPDYHRFMDSTTKLLQYFTFSHYNTRIQNEIFTS